MSGKRRVYSLLLFVLLLVLTAYAARAASGSDILINERVTVPADGVKHAFVFSPTANNIYDFGAFGDGLATASLYLDGEGYLFEDTPFPFEARLIADRTYTIEVTAEHSAMQLEIMRQSSGRTFYNPNRLTTLDARVNKIIARAYDTHWFRFTAPEDGFYSIRSESEMNMVGYLLDKNGVRLAMNDNLYTPYALDFRIEAQLRAGEEYVLRVAARGEGTGAYDIVFAVPDGTRPLPEIMAFDPEYIDLQVGESMPLHAVLSPTGARSDAVYISANRDIATVDANGVVTARAPGETQVIIADMRHVEARAIVRVASTPVTSITPEQDEITVAQGAYFELGYALSPATADARGIELVSDDPNIVEIADGRLFAKKQGTTAVTLYAQEKRVQARVLVTVAPEASAYRALLLGEHRYLDGRTRLGSINTTQGIADLLDRVSFGGARYETTTLLDSTATGALGAIADAFGDATAQDVSLVYVNSHGGVTNGQAWIEFHDGSRLTARQLARALRQVPGTIVLIVDCCQSGAFLSLDSKSDFNGRFIAAFSPNGRSSFLSTKFRILTSTSAVSNSYRISFEGKDSAEGAMATVFARSLCESGGWNLIQDRAARVRGDFNKDGMVTLHEAYLFTRARVRRYLDLAGERGAQDVQVFPTGSPFVLFEWD